MNKFEFNRIYHKTWEEFQEAALSLKPRSVHVYGSMGELVEQDPLEKKCIDLLGLDEEALKHYNLTFGYTFIAPDGSFHRHTNILYFNRFDEDKERFKRNEKFTIEEKDLARKLYRQGISIAEGLVYINDLEQRRYFIFKPNDHYNGVLLLPPITDPFTMLHLCGEMHFGPKISRNASAKCFIDTLRELDKDKTAICIKSGIGDYHWIEVEQGIDNYLLFLPLTPDTTKK